MSESKVLRDIRKRLGQRVDTVIWRNEAGRHELDAVHCPKCGYERPGRWVTFGLQLGAGDLIGMHRGRFLSVEAKSTSGRASAEQVRFRDLVLNQGGIAGIVRSADEAEELLT